MRWRTATIVLAAVLVGATAWIALRDYQSAGALDGQRALALDHARRLAGMPDRRWTCTSCGLQLLGGLREHVWRVQLGPAADRRCVDIDNDRFAIRRGGAVVGVRAVVCPYV